MMGVSLPNRMENVVVRQGAVPGEYLFAGLARSHRAENVP
jgi:hypothetical protein